MSRFGDLLRDKDLIAKIEKKVSAAEYLPALPTPKKSLIQDQKEIDDQVILKKRECLHKECLGFPKCKRERSYGGIDW